MSGRAGKPSLAPDIFKTAARASSEAFESKGLSKYVRKACKKIRRRAKRSESRFLIRICKMTSNTEEKAHRYRTKVKYIEAIKWTGSNLDNVKEFIKDRYVASIDDYGGLTVGPSDTAFSLYVPKGYYISKDKDGKLSVNVGLVFESEYERYKHGR